MRLLGVELASEVDLFPRQQAARLDRHQRRRHDEELAGGVDVDRLQVAQMGEVLVADADQRHLADVHLLLLHQVEQQVERTGEVGELEVVVHGAAARLATRTCRSASSATRTR
jgi:hypothetical protein